jgi:hypothetical protein
VPRAGAAVLRRDSRFYGAWRGSELLVGFNPTRAPPYSLKKSEIYKAFMETSVVLGYVYSMNAASGVEEHTTDLNGETWNS